MRYDDLGDEYAYDARGNVVPRQRPKPRDPQEFQAARRALAEARRQRLDRERQAQPEPQEAS